MAARIIDGKAVSDRRRTALTIRVRTLAGRGVHPVLAAITVSSDHGWSVYQRSQAAACAAVGIQHRSVMLPEGANQEDLLDAVERLNVDADVHGIIVQSPLPPSFDSFAMQARISPDKDIEGVGPANLGLVLAGRPALAPCTALSAVALAKEACPDLRGCEAVVIGASTIVGKPVAQLLTAAGATVTLCQITTRDVAAHAQRADLLVVAVGKAGLVTKTWIKPGAVVIDVGINRITDSEGKAQTVGDVAAEVVEVAGALTPVPGGVGALTTTILLEATVDAAERLASSTNAVDAQAVSRLLGGLDLAPDTSERIATLLSRHLIGGSASTGLARTTPLERRISRIRDGGGALLLDGAMGTELLRRGVAPALVNQANLDHPDLVLAVHRDHLAAGAEALTANTFGLNRHRVRDRDQLMRLISASIRLARQAAQSTNCSAAPAFVLGSIGPLGPTVGAELSPADATDAFAEIALAMQDAQVDGFLIETMPSTREAAAALAGVRRVSRLPVLACRTIERIDEADLAEFARAVEDGQAQAIGVNCAAGPRALGPVAAALARASRLPVLARPNAGFPTRTTDGRSSYLLRPDYLVEQMRGYIANGVAIIGGCCGVGPAHIQALSVLKGTAVGTPPRSDGGTAIYARPAALADHPLLRAMHGAQSGTAPLPALAFVPARLTASEAAGAGQRLARASAIGIGLLAGWPGSPRGSRLVASLAHAERSAGCPGIVEVLAADTTLAAAEEKLQAAHLVGIRTVLIDAGVFQGSASDGMGVDPVRVLWLVQQLNQGRDRAGNRQDPTAFAVGVRLPVNDDRAEAYVAAGAHFLTIQPVYRPAIFRAAMERLRTVQELHLTPFVSLVLLLPDAATADELDNELPSLAVPEALKRRLVADPDDDVKGVLRFLAHWRDRLAGVCVLTADARVEAAERVIAGIRTIQPRSPE